MADRYEEDDEDENWPPNQLTQHKRKKSVLPKFDHLETYWLLSTPTFRINFLITQKLRTLFVIEFKSWFKPAVVPLWIDRCLLSIIKAVIMYGSAKRIYLHKKNHKKCSSSFWRSFLLFVVCVYACLWVFCVMVWCNLKKQMEHFNGCTICVDDISSMDGYVQCEI